MKRSRRGGRRPQSSGSPQVHSQNYNPNRTFDSSGPEIKIRGSAAQVYEKYLQLARDANASGDRVMAESYLQHAEHYYRILAAAQAQQQQYQLQQGNGANGNGNGNGASRPANGTGEQPYTDEQPNDGQNEGSFAAGENSGEENQPSDSMNEGF